MAPADYRDPLQYEVLTVREKKERQRVESKTEELTRRVTLPPNVVNLANADIREAYAAIKEARASLATLDKLHTARTAKYTSRQIVIFQRKLWLDWRIPQEDAIYDAEEIIKQFDQAKAHVQSPEEATEELTAEEILEQYWHDPQAMDELTTRDSDNLQEEATAIATSNAAKFDQVKAHVQSPVEATEELAAQNVQDLQPGQVSLDRVWHVAGSINTADYSSRGSLTMAEIGPGSEWQTGPAFIGKRRESWPINRNFTRTIPEKEIRKKFVRYSYPCQ